VVIWFKCVHWSRDIPTFKTNNSANFLFIITPRLIMGHGTDNMYA